MDKVEFEFREPADVYLPEPVRLPDVQPLEPAELERRKGIYRGLCELLTSIGRERDYWEVHTYGELIAAALDALEKERQRIDSYCPPK